VYGGNVSRKSGKRWALYTAPGYEFIPTKNKDYSDGNTTRDFYRNDNILYTRFGMSFAYEKPINLFWQNSFWSSLEYRQRNIRRMDKNHLTDEKQKDYTFEPQGLHYSIGQRISYFPTTRTSAYANYGLSYFYVVRSKSQTQSGENWISKSEYKYREHYLLANMGAGISYFFSPQLQLNLETSLNYQYQHVYFYNRHSSHYGGLENFHSRQKLNSRPSSFRFYIGMSVNYTFY
jgi:hypothetical protein